MNHFSILRHVSCTQNGQIWFHVVLFRFPDDGPLRAETCRNVTRDIIT
jgi:hypothetical protein